MRVAVALALALAGGSARADTRDAPVFSMGGTLHGRFALTFGPFAVLSGWGAARWWDRLHTAVRVSTGFGGDVRLVEQTGEVGLWLHPSRKVDLLLAWRAGYAYLRLTGDDARPVGINTFTLSPVVEFSVHVTPAIDLRVSPFVFTGYYANLFQITAGPEIGVAWEF